MCASTAHTMSIATAHCVIGGNVRNSCHTLFASEISFSIVLHQQIRDERINVPGPSHSNNRFNNLWSQSKPIYPKTHRQLCQVSSISRQPVLRMLALAQTFGSSIRIRRFHRLKNKNSRVLRPSHSKLTSPKQAWWELTPPSSPAPSLLSSSRSPASAPARAATARSASP